MKQNTRMRILCGLIAATLLTVSALPAVPVYAAPEPTDIQKQIQKQVMEQIEYTIEHENELPRVEDDWYSPYWWDYCHHRPICWYGGPWSIELEEGSTYKINLHGDGSFQSTNGGIAGVDSYGNVTGVSEGYCEIRVLSYDGLGVGTVRVHVRGSNRNKNNNNNNNNVVYVPQPVYNPAATNASWLAIATNLVVSAPRNGTVNLSSLTPLSFDANFANVLKLRPDVTVNVTYGFNGHTFLLTIPRGYNLAGKLNPAGLVDFVTLSNVVDGRIMCRLLY